MLYIDWQCIFWGVIRISSPTPHPLITNAVVCVAGGGGERTGVWIISIWCFFYVDPWQGFVEESSCSLSCFKPNLAVFHGDGEMEENKKWKLKTALKNVDLSLVAYFIMYYSVS